MATAGGCSSYATCGMVVSPQPTLKAAWVALNCPEVRQVPLKSCFTPNVTCLPGPTLPYTLRWDLGDGAQSTGANSTHAFNTLGHFLSVVYRRFNNSLCETAVFLSFPRNEQRPAAYK